MKTTIEGQNMQMHAVIWKKILQNSSSDLEKYFSFRMTQIVVDSVYRRNLAGTLWSVSGHIVGGPNNPRGPDAEIVEPVIVTTGGPPLPQKRAPPTFFLFF